MLKRQINGLSQVATGREAQRFHREYHRTDLMHVHYTKDYVYASNGYEVYRLPNDSDEITYAVKPYPKMDTFIVDAGADSVDVVLNTNVLGEQSGYKLCRIGRDFYDAAKIKRAYQILGKDIRGWESRYQRGLHLWSDEGDGFILPVRILDDTNLN